MGLKLLEKDFQQFLKDNGEELTRLKSVAEKVLTVQQAMRGYLDEITPIVCKTCETPCCRLMPVEGWFTKNDYYLFRIFYENPAAFIDESRSKEGCLFLGAQGCVLPGDLRSFPCVKVNCRAVKDCLKKKGWDRDFNHLYDELCRLQEHTWKIIK